MKGLLTRLAAALPAFFFCLFLAPGLRGQDVVLQGFYWNTIPGDVSNTTSGGMWWDTIASVSTKVANAGFKTVWLPPATKGFAGVYDMGYGVHDYYDFGRFNQNGSTRTRHGNDVQFQSMVSTLHAKNLLVMADLVLNHRAGASTQEPEACDPDNNGLEMRYTAFAPASNRLPMSAANFHPNPTHCDLTAPYHDRSFFEDLCYFNILDNKLDNTPPNYGWYFGPHNLGQAGDSLIQWGRYLRSTIGIDEFRLDAVKHIEPGFLAPFLVELNNGTQPFAVGELFDGNLGTLKSYHDQVEAFVTTYGTGSKNASLAIFDFNLRYALRDLCNNTGGGYNMWNLNTSGLRFNPAGALPAEDIVTFVENHDVDRIGFVTTTCSDPAAVLTYGSTCLKYNTDSGHDPVTSDKEDMAYPYLMAAEGRPTVFWKDYFWYGMDDDIQWQMALRTAMAKGNSTPIQSLSPVFTTGNGGDLFVLNRAGTTGGASDGLVLALNDNPGLDAQVWVNTPFSNKYLKDYSDGYMFQYTRAFGDTRAQVKAQRRDYAWWSVTGLYPKSPGTAASHFNMDATPGGCPHFVAFCVADAANLQVNGAPIAAGDEVAVQNAAGRVVGIGRVGQGFKWDGAHDMIVEVLGAPSTNGMANGETLRFVVWDQSAGQEVTIGFVQYASTGAAFNFSAERPNSPNRNGNNATFSVTPTAQGLFTCGGISRVTGFSQSPVAGNVDYCGSFSQANAGVYDDGLQVGDNDGTGFLGWTGLNPASNSGVAGFFVGNSGSNGDGDGNGDGDINTAGEAWGFYANSSNVAEATRPFAVPMTPGVTLSLRLDNGWLDDATTTGVVGFSLRNSGGQNLMEFYFVEGNSHYTINDATGSSPNNSGIPFTDEGLAIEIEMLTATTYQLRVAPLAGGGPYSFDRTFSNSGSPDRVRFFNYSAGNNDPKNLFVNNLRFCFAPTLVINEVDYDQPSGDTQEFVELKNVSNASVSLSDYKLEILDNAGAVVNSLTLPATSLPAGGYYVVCGAGAGVPNCNAGFAGANDQLPDGPAAARLVRNAIFTVDAVAWEGSVPGGTEGAAVAAGDNATTAGLGLSRVPDGSDSDNNNSDFVLTCATPGAANTGANTDSDSDGLPDACDACPLANQAAVPNFNPATCACNPGYFASYTAGVITACTLCPPGKFCPDGLIAFPCPINTYQDLSGAVTCNSCPAGTHALEGSVLCDPNTAPQIALSGNNNSIPNRALTVNATNETDFGAVAVSGGSVTRTFTVSNLFGSNPLVLDGVPLVTVADRNASDFTVTQPVTTTLDGGTITTFTVTFDPSAAGLRSAIIVLTHNDLPQNPFVFTVQGTGL